MRRLFTFSSKLLLPMLLPLLFLGAWDHFLVARTSQSPGTDDMMTAYRAASPDIVILGNSITRTAFDENLIQERLYAAGLQEKIFKYHVSASGPPIWYLALKNVIFDSPHSPKILILSARDYMFTDTTYGMSGNYLRQYLPLYAKKYEPLLEQKTFAASRKRASMDQLLYNYSNFYYNRDVYQHAVRRLSFKVTADVTEFTASITGATAAQHRAASLETAFHSKEGLAGALRSAYNDPTKEVAYLDTPQDEQSDVALLRNQAGLQGDALIESSYLPDIINLCREHGVRLILVRHYPYATSAASRAEGDRRWATICDYLSRVTPEVSTIDMGLCPEMTQHDFYAGQHYTEAGQILLSEYFSQQLIPLLQSSPYRVPRT